MSSANFRRKIRPSRSRVRSQRRLLLESLEKRCLLAGDVAGEQTNGPVSVSPDPLPIAEIAAPAEVDSALPTGRAAEGEAKNSVHFRFVYPNDADPSGFFRNHPERKVLLETAGKLLTDRLSDTLDAIPNTPRLSWTASYNDPGTGINKAVPANFSVAANEIVVFVGARNLQRFDSDPVKLTRAYAEGIKGFNYTFAAGVGAAEVAAFDSLLRTRGETNVLISKPTDFAPILGSLSFDTRPSTVNNMYFEQGSMEPNQFRFLTFAQHELAHILGFGLAPSYATRINGSSFDGAAVNRVYGGPVPLEPPDGAHFNRSVAAQGVTIMGPAVDSQELFQELDFAALDDIGWDLVPDNRPAVTLTTADAVLVESAGSIEITATLSAAVSTAITLPISLSGAASTSTDVRLSAPNFVFPPNQTTAKITVDIVDDNVDETTEAVTISIVDNPSIRLGNDTSFRLTIFDDDGVTLPTVPRIDPASVGNSIDIPGDNQPRTIVFRSPDNRNLSITANNVDQISESVLLFDKDQNIVGTYGPTGLASAALVAGESYAVVFYPRLTARTFAINLPGGFARAMPRTNVLLRPDVNGNGTVTEVDALQIINQLNRAGNNPSVDSPTVIGDGFYDVSGDGLLTAVDALQVINFLNALPNADSEGGPLDASGDFESLENSTYSRTVADTDESRDSSDLRVPLVDSSAAEVSRRMRPYVTVPDEFAIDPISVLDKIWEEESREFDSNASPMSPLSGISARIDLDWAVQA